VSPHYKKQAHQIEIKEDDQSRASSGKNEQAVAEVSKSIERERQRSSTEDPLKGL
jgi:uncharacterized protein YjbJ (UPF0337 family)